MLKVLLLVKEISALFNFLQFCNKQQKTMNINQTNGFTVVFLYNTLFL